MSPDHPPSAHTSDARTLVGQGSLYALATAAPIAVSGLITPLVTRGLGANEYGLVAVALAIIQLGQILLAAGFPTAITRHVVMESGGSKSAAAHVLFNAALATSAAAVLSLASLSGGPALDWSLEFTLAVILAIASSAGIATFTSTQALIRGEGKAARFVRQAIIMSFLPPLLALATALVTSGGALVYISSLTGTQVAVAVAVTAPLMRAHRPKFKWNSARKALKIGLPTVPHQLSAIAVTSLTVIFAGQLIGAQAAGELQLAFLTGSLPLFLLGALNNSWALQVYSISSDARARFIAASSTLVAWIMFALTVSTALAAPYAIDWLAPASMDRARMVVGVTLVACAGPLMVLYLANIHPVFVDGRTGPLALLTPLAASVGIGIPLIVYSTWPSSGTIALATGVAPFYLVQSVFATVQRRASSCPRVRLKQPMVIAALGITTCFTVLLFDPGPSTRLTLLAVIFITTIGLLTRVLRSRAN